LAAAYQNYVRDRLGKLGFLVIIALVVHTFFTFVVRPTAESWLVQQREITQAHPEHKPERILYVIIKDPEQEVTIILAFWGLLLAGLRAWDLQKQRKLLGADLVKLPAGFVILPDDAREHLRRLDSLPAEQRDAVPSRILRNALKRFGTTGNVQDASTTVHNVAESEAARLDAELAILRFSVWAIPAIGFVGTVRGIGIALQGAQLAFQGDTTAVTGGLGVSFNSTLVALTLSIFMMYTLHEVTLAQERLVLDAEHYADEQLISRMHGK